jgi:hypothetical protein
MGRALWAVTAQEPEVSSATAVTVRWINCYEKRSRPRGGERRVEADAARRGEYFVILALTAVFENMLSNLPGG